ncbi:MAG: C_GCAxxG_C_C family protein [Oscillospiraceae bacterium]|nr:C_GCAxxG_C_C family protein [Oscillospiraceae bacterium]
MNYGKKAADLFEEGYNCAQAVTVAFCDMTGLEPDYAARLSSSFGGGMGRMREVCGAVSGMLLVAGILYGYDSKTDDAAKKAHYTVVQELAGKFREEHGSIICRELLNTRDTDPAPTPRTPEYYKLRPCAQMVWTAAEILEAYIAEHPVA